MSAQQPAEDEGLGAGDVQGGQLAVLCEDLLRESVPSRGPCRKRPAVMSEACTGIRVSSQKGSSGS